MAYSKTPHCFLYLLHSFTARSNNSSTLTYIKPINHKRNRAREELTLFFADASMNGTLKDLAKAATSSLLTTRSLSRSLLLATITMGPSVQSLTRKIWFLHLVTSLKLFKFSMLNTMMKPSLSLIHWSRSAEYSSWPAVSKIFTQIRMSRLPLLNGNF